MLESFQSLIASGSPLVFGAALLAGVLSSLSPCVYPILPITIGVLGRSGQGEAGWPTLAGNAGLYCLGLAFVYSALGYAAAAMGAFFGAIATHPLTLLLAANLLFLFAAWSMGWVSLPGWYPAASQGGGKWQMLAMGALSGLVMGPCTAPIFGALMFYVFRTGNRLEGSLMLFCFALGMALVLALVGLLSTWLGRVPRSAWMLRWSGRMTALLVFGAGQFLLLQAGAGLS